MIGKEPVQPIADGSMILKLMYGNTTAERLQNPADPHGRVEHDRADGARPEASKDGWYWGSWDPQATEASQLDWPPPANLPYPWMGFGYYCLNCHASAKSESTFSSLNNVLGNPDTFVKFYFQDQPPIAGEPKQPAIETLSAHERFEPLQDLLSKVESSGAAVEQGALAEPEGAAGQPAVHRLFARLPQDVRRAHHRAAGAARDHRALHAARGLRPRLRRDRTVRRSS